MNSETMETPIIAHCGGHIRHVEGLHPIRGGFAELRDAFMASKDDTAGDGRYVSGPFANAHRNKESAMPRAWLALDLDDVADEIDFAKIVEAAEDWAGFGYTTRSHAPHAGVFRLRLVFEVSRAIEPAEYKAAHDGLALLLQDLAGCAVVPDPNCDKIEQALYTVREGSTTFDFDGAPVDVDAAMARARQALPQPKPQAPDYSGSMPDSFAQPERIDYCAALLQGEDLHGNALRLVGRLVAQGLDNATIEAVFEGLRPTLIEKRGVARVDELLRRELGAMVAGARSKGYGPAGARAVPAWANGSEPHPLTIYSPWEDMPRQPRMVIPGFVPDGIVAIAGEAGSGKTSVVVPLALIAAGVHGIFDPLAPKHWRHVVYVSEDVEQAQRVARGWCDTPEFLALARERFHVVAAQRMPAELVAQAAPSWCFEFTREADGLPILPLVVVDTRSALFAVDDENDNARASALVAVLKQGFNGLPVWIIGHVAKGAEPDRASMRGAGAIEGDVDCTAILTNGASGRKLNLKKTRFEARAPALLIGTGTREVDGVDEWGAPCRVTLRWGVPEIPLTDLEPISTQPANERREDARARQKAEQAEAARDAMRADILRVVSEANARREGINLEAVRAAVTGRSTDKGDMVNLLISTGDLLEVAIPAKERTNVSRRSFLVCLSDEHREALKQGAPLPPELIAIPPGWGKPPKAEPAPSPEPPGTGDTPTDPPEDGIPHIPVSGRSLKENTLGTSGGGAEAPLPPDRPPPSLAAVS